LPRSAGHRAGAESAREIIEAAPRLGIHTLTLFALSSANWKRPAPEVQAILRLLHEYLLTETTHCIDEGVRLSIIGRRDRLPATLRQAIADSEAATAKGPRLHLRLAVDYSAREAIYHAACRFYKAAFGFSIVGMRFRGICVPAETVAGLYRRRSGCCREGIRQTRTYAWRIAGCHRRII
jgi:undecaprenyl diphosphate synthase